MGVEGIGKAILKLNAPAFIFDCDGTATYVERPTAKSTLNYFADILARRSSYNLNQAGAYATEHIRYILSDSDIGVIKPAVSKIFCKISKSNKESMERAEMDFLRNYEAPYFREILRLFNKTGDGNKNFVVSTRRLNANPVLGHFGLSSNGYCVSNSMEFDERGNFIDFNLPMKTSEDKFMMTKEKVEGELGIPLKKCIFFGNGRIDEELANKCGLSVASPLSDDVMKRAADYVVEGKYGYGSIVKELQQEMQ
jgi:hypothetical protein